MATQTERKQVARTFPARTFPVRTSFPVREVVHPLAKSYFNRLTAAGRSVSDKGSVNRKMWGLTNAGLIPGLISCLLMKSTENAGTGSVVYDVKSNNYNLSLINGPTWGSAGITTNGIDNYIQSPAITSPTILELAGRPEDSFDPSIGDQGSAMTIFSVANITDNETTPQCLIITGDDYFGGAGYLNVNTDFEGSHAPGGFQFSVNSNARTVTQGVSSGFKSYGGVWDTTGAGIGLYIDGTNRTDGTVDTGTGKFFRINSLLTIGAATNETTPYNFTEAIISSILIWRRKLNASEMLALHEIMI